MSKLNKTSSAEKAGALNSSSQYRGVSFNNHSQKWKAVITVGRKQYFLGYFVNENEAARAYDKASLELRGPEAPTNFKYDNTTLAQAATPQQAAAFSSSAQAPPPSYEEEDDNGMELEGPPKDASLEQLEPQTNDSMESVRDVELELNAIKNSINKRNIPPEYMCL